MCNEISQSIAEIFYETIRKKTSSSALWRHWSPDDRSAHFDIQRPPSNDRQTAIHHHVDSQRIETRKKQPRLNQLDLPNEKPINKCNKNQQPNYKINMPVKLTKSGADPGEKLALFTGKNQVIILNSVATLRRTFSGWVVHCFCELADLDWTSGCLQQ